MVDEADVVLIAKGSISRVDCETEHVHLDLTVLLKEVVLTGNNLEMGFHLTSLLSSLTLKFKSPKLNQADSGKTGKARMLTLRSPALWPVQQWAAVMA